jgi:hypothetical protein
MLLLQEELGIRPLKALCQYDVNGPPTSFPTLDDGAKRTVLRGFARKRAALENARFRARQAHPARAAPPMAGVRGIPCPAAARCAAACELPCRGWGSNGVVAFVCNSCCRCLQQLCAAFNNSGLPSCGWEGVSCHSLLREVCAVATPLLRRQRRPAAACRLSCARLATKCNECNECNEPRSHPPQGLLHSCALRQDRC